VLEHRRGGFSEAQEAMSTNDTAAQESAATTEAESYTEHVEPDHVGGKRYVRCESCGRELLLSLGGTEKLVHAEGCPNAGDRR
jgi:hypothetical protein